MNTIYSIPLNSLCDRSGYPLQLIPELVYGDDLSIEFSAIDANLDPVDLSGAVIWNFTLDVDRKAETVPLCETGNSLFSYNASNKTLSFSVNSKTLAFLLAVNGKSRLMLVAELSGYDADRNRIFRFSWNMTGVMPVSGGEVPDEEDVVPIVREKFTAFEVYPNASAIPAGTEHPELGYITAEIPAQMTEKFTIRSNYQHFDSDVVVDWGDGTASTLAKGEFESENLADWNEENQFEATVTMSHTYLQEGRYTVKIYGEKYFCLSNRLTTANNLMCRCFDRDLPLSDNVNNLTHWGKNALRLTKVCIPAAMDFRRVENFGDLFQDCTNLLYAWGLKRKIQLVRCSAEIFYGCSALIKTDLILPTAAVESNSSLKKCFSGCRNLNCNISALIPSCGFSNRIISVMELFKDCSSLFGTVPAALLWEDDSKVWIDTASAFSGCSESIRSQVPVSWGGTNSSIEA